MPKDDKTWMYVIGGIVLLIIAIPYIKENLFATQEGDTLTFDFQFGASECTYDTDCANTNSCWGYSCTSGKCVEKTASYPAKPTACPTNAQWLTYPNCEWQCIIVDPTCTDGVMNGNETGIDCGGSCTSCNNGFDWNQCLIPLGDDSCITNLYAALILGIIVFVLILIK